MPNRITKAQECDARGDDSSNTVGYIINSLITHSAFHETLKN